MRSHRLALVGDFRSPLARDWAELCAGLFREVITLSTVPASWQPSVDGIQQLNLPSISGRITKGSNEIASSRTPIASIREQRRRVVGFVRSSSRAVDTVAAFAAPWARLTDVDLVHGLRATHEGAIASIIASRSHTPFVLSLWGNELIRLDRADRFSRYQTLKSLRAADALHADTERDLELALGLRDHPPLTTLISPGNGGVDIDEFSRPKRPVARLRWRADSGTFLVANVRGFRDHVRTLEFLESIAILRRSVDQLRVACLGLRGMSHVERQVERLDLADIVDLYTIMPREAVASLLVAADVSVSPSTYDGTPNSILESLVAGTPVVAGRIESVEPLIQPGLTGELCEATDPHSIAASLQHVYRQRDYWSARRGTISAMAGSKYGRPSQYRRVGQFYKRILTGRSACNSR